MKKIFLLTVVLCIAFFSSYAQDSTHTTTAIITSCSMTPYAGKSYVFNGNVQIVECDAVGHSISANPANAIKGSVFDVVSIISPDCDLVIQFHVWKNIDPTSFIKRQMYNYKSTADKDVSTITKSNDNIRYFILKKNDMINICSEYVNPRTPTVAFGTFSMPFKFRPSKSNFTSNLSLGTSVYVNSQLTTNSSCGFVVGLSLSSVSLDSLSTNGKIKTSSDRPAITPSFSLVYAYKNINFIFGVGADYINKTSAIEQNWIYNGKPWLGFGIGINLFSAASTQTTTTTQKQKN